MVLAAGQLARRLGVPLHTVGTLSASKIADGQSQQEGTWGLIMSLFAGANVINHATGWLEGGLVTSFEKTMMDADLCGKLCRFFEGIDLSENAQAMDAIAATAGPGLIGGVLIGLTTGKALALACGAPFYGINHLEGHALTARLTHDVEFPYLLLLVSGGHCQLCQVYGVGDYALLGTTRDDAVGEAFDKAAKLLGLGYPGGPEIEARAARGDASRFALPRPLIGHDDSGCDFSFSGLKTALRQRAIEMQPISETDICDLAAGFQAAIADCLTDRCRAAIKEFSPSASDAERLIVAGGVAANQFLRHALDEVAVEAGLTLTVPPPKLCTDNAAMIAWAGAERLHAGSAADAGLASPARARWPLSENAL